MLEVESGISPGVVASRGYWTATKRQELEGLVKTYQRRVPALVVPTYSPDRETTSLQVRPDSPRVRDGKAVRYETPADSRCILDVHPSMHDAAKDPARDKWVTEGTKKGDSLASRGECAISLAGVWNFQRDGELLKCWKHIALERSTVYIVFDSDVMVKVEVQMALERLVAALEDRGARVLVVYLPDAPDGSKQGVDDYLAGGGSVAELRLMARSYEAGDLGEIRLSRDERLRAAVAELWASWRDMPARRQPECSDRATMRDLLKTAERGGEVLEDGSVRVIRSARDGALATGRGLGGWIKSVNRLEEAGRIRRDNEGRAPDKAGAFILLGPGRAESEQVGGRGARGEGQERTERVSELFRGAYDRGVHSLRASSEEVPELRWSKVILYWGRKDGKRVVVDSHYVPRLGKRRREIIVYLLAAGAPVPVEDLREIFGTTGEQKRPRDFRRRVLDPLEVAGILALSAAETATLTDRWREVLEARRRADEEIQDAERQRQRYAEARKKFKRRNEHPADRTPPLLAPELLGRLLEERAREEKRRAVEAEREKVGVTPAVFLADELEGVAGVRWRELRARWIDRGGKPEMLRQAVFSGPYRFQREEVDNHLYVYHAPASEPDRAPAAVPEEPPRRGPYKRADDVYVHPPDCACEWCAEDVKPRYAKQLTRVISKSADSLSEIDTDS
jgi:hypothetical protein